MNTDWYVEEHMIARGGTNAAASSRLQSLLVVKYKTCLQYSQSLRIMTESTRNCVRHVFCNLALSSLCPELTQVPFWVPALPTVVLHIGAHEVDPVIEYLPTGQVIQPHPPYTSVVAFENFPEGHWVQDGPLLFEHPQSPYCPPGQAQPYCPGPLRVHAREDVQYKTESVPVVTSGAKKTASTHASSVVVVVHAFPEQS